MYRVNKIYFLILLAVSIGFNSCSTVPITGRSKLDLVSNSEMIAMSFQQYDDFLNSHELSRDKKRRAMVKKVGRKIEGAVKKFFDENNLSDELRGFEWEFNLIEDEAANAWAMPGGKVVFYTGILPICRNEKGIAVVMGHEVAHAIAKHGSERMSQGLLSQLGGVALSVALDSKPAKTRNLWLAAYGLGTQVGVMLPFSRLHESEADHLGLIFMAIAGYNPNEAVDFWKRMSEMKGGSAPPEFLSTHPSDRTRIEDIRELLPEAMKYYKK